MAAPPTSDSNPYQSPRTPADARPPVAHESLDASMVVSFRQEIHALGAFWILAGVAAGPAAWLMATASPTLPRSTISLLVGMLGAVALVLGIAACMKQLWAVRAGLLLCYLSLPAHLVGFNMCAPLTIIVMVLVILQAHRVLGWAAMMRAAGAPLTWRPPR